MRKSERIRLLEMELLRTQFEIEILRASVGLILDKESLKAPEMDAGKWYAKKLKDLKEKP